MEPRRNGDFAPRALPVTLGSSDTNCQLSKSVSDGSLPRLEVAHDLLDSWVGASDSRITLINPDVVCQHIMLVHPDKILLDH
jgi:hypothetical protein